MYIVLQLHIVFCLTNPLVKICHHGVIGAPTVTVSTVIFFVSSFFDFAGLHEHQGDRLLQKIIANPHCDRIFPEPFPEDLFCNGIGKFRVEITAVNDDLVPAVILD
jgi:hypothetical protein